MSEHAPQLPMEDSAAPHPDCSCEVGRPDDGDLMHVDVILKPGAHRRAAATRALGEFERTHPLEREPWSEEQLDELLGPDEDGIERVRRFAAAHQLEVLDVCRARRDVTLAGPVSRFNEAFGIRLSHFSAGTESFRSHEDEVRLPPGLAPIVDSVLGLDEAPLHDCLAAPASPRRISLPPDRFADYYQFPAEWNGSGQRIAVFSFGGGFHEDDLRRMGVPPERVQVVTVNGKGNDPLDTETLAGIIEALETGGPPQMMREFSAEQAKQFAATLEATMDLQLIGVLAPGAQLDAWFISSGARAYRHALHAAIGLPTGPAQEIQPPGRTANIISISWGNPECVLGANKLRGLAAAFQLAALRGVTVCVASGDFGSRGTNPALHSTRTANVVFPASSPYVLACGGSSIETPPESSVDGQVPIQGERAWNSSAEGIPMATGGGWSGLFERPDYQRQMEFPVQDQNQPPHTWLSGLLTRQDAVQTRGVPDVAANADPLRGYSVWLGGRSFISAGTSAATPVWAALVARMNQELKRPLGWFNSALYSPGVRSTFRPILQGDNDVAGGEIAFYSAASGWNACTGLGTPYGKRLVAQLREPPSSE